MKFHWGHGILLVLIVFLLASAGVIIFAFNQDVNLVEKNYYEKGVDYSTQMKTDSRSQTYTDSIKIEETPEYYFVRFSEVLSTKIDSGSILFYFPRDSKMDISFPLTIINSQVEIEKIDLLKGRYEVKIGWYMGGQKFEVNKTIVSK